MNPLLALALPLLPLLPGDSHVPKARLAAPEVELPMETWGNRPVVRARFGESEPLRMLIDTGTTFTVIDEKAAERIGLERITLSDSDLDSMMARMGHGKGHADSVSLDAEGRARFEDLTVYTRDFEKMGTTEIDGVLGLPFFRDVTLTLDSVEGVIVLKRDPLEPGPRDIRYAAPEGVPSGISLEIRVEDQTYDAHLDTGSGSFLILPERALEDLTLDGEARVIGQAQTPMGSFEIREGALVQPLRLGSHTFENPTVRFGQLPGPGGPSESANIGMGLLGSFRLTLDQRTRILRLEDPAEGADHESARAAPRIEPGSPPRTSDASILLDRMSGRCTIEARMRRSPGGPFTPFEGKATWSQGHHGRYVREEFRMEVGGRVLEGEVFLGPHRDGGYELVQVDSGNPSMIHVAGAWDASTQTLRMESLTGGRPLLWVYRLDGERGWVKEMYGRRGADSEWDLLSDYRYVLE